MLTGSRLRDPFPFGIYAPSWPVQFGTPVFLPHFQAGVPPPFLSRFSGTAVDIGPGPNGYKHVSRSTQWPLPTPLFETPRAGAQLTEAITEYVLDHLHSLATLLNGCHRISPEMKLALYNGFY